MAKIIVQEPSGPYSATLDTEAMAVVIRECFLGVRFVSPSEDMLSVSMRDNGFEIHYAGVWWDFKDGAVNAREPLP